MFWTLNFQPQGGDVCLRCLTILEDINEVFPIRNTLFVIRSFFKRTHGVIFHILKTDSLNGLVIRFKSSGQTMNHNQFLPVNLHKINVVNSKNFVFFESLHSFHYAEWSIFPVQTKSR